MHMRRQPPCRDFLGNPFPFCIITQLILINFPNIKILRFMVGEVPAADGGGWVHGVAFGQGDAGVFGGVEQREQFFFFGVVGASGVTGGGADALVGFVDEGGVVQGFVAGVAPVVLADLLVQVFGEGFG